MKMISLMITALGWACVGTVAVETVCVSVLWSDGRLSTEKIMNMVAIGYGVDEQSLEESDSMPKLTDIVQPSFEETLAGRKRIRLDFDLREMAIDKSSISLRFFKSLLDEEKEQYDETRRQFEMRRQILQGAANDEALLEVQRTLVSLPPRQAKDQILRMLDDDAIKNDDRAMNDLVTMIKFMPIDARKKILAEFKSDVEQQRLGDILQKIRQGAPHVDLIRKTREQLRQFKSKNNHFSPQDRGSNDDTNPV